MRESFIFYKSYADQLRKLPDEQFATIMKAIFDYALEGAEGELGVIESVIFGLIKPQLDANNTRYENGKKGGEFGSKGGRPKNPTETPNKPQVVGLVTFVTIKKLEKQPFSYRKRLF